MPLQLLKRVILHGNEKFLDPVLGPVAIYVFAVEAEVVEEAVHPRIIQDEVDGCKFFGSDSLKGDKLIVDQVGQKLVFDLAQDKLVGAHRIVLLEYARQLLLLLLFDLTLPFQLHQMQVPTLDPPDLHHHRHQPVLMLPVVLRVVPHRPLVLLPQRKYVLALVVLRMQGYFVLLSQFKHRCIVFTDPSGPHFHCFTFNLLQPGVLDLDPVFPEGLLDGEGANPASESGSGLEQNEPLAHLGQVAGGLDAGDASTDNNKRSRVWVIVFCHDEMMN